MTENSDNRIYFNSQNPSVQENLDIAETSVNSSSPSQSSASSLSSNNSLLDLATGGSESSNLSSAGDDEVPTGTPREERLARKLKVIDVLSPKSSLDFDNSVDSDNNTNTNSKENIAFSGPLHSPIPVATTSTRVAVRQEMFPDPPTVSSTISTDTILRTPPQQQQQQRSLQHQQRVPANNVSWNNVRHHQLPTRVNLLVGGTRFVVNPSLFTKHPNTMLGRMFSSPNGYWRSNDLEEHEIAQDIAASVFKIVLEYYKCGSMRCPPSVNVSELREACDYFLIPFNSENVICQNLSELLHELSNDGAKERFKSQFVEDVILPKMIECAQRGNRECHLVILKDDDVVEWGEFPPNTGEEHADIVHCTTLYRFFKYFENRDVAKEVLTERGLKKVKLGIEGYPTHMEKVKYKQHGKPEVIYNYIQRPFVHMSWEKEGSKSRHVDFQCVKPKHSVHGAVDEPAAMSRDDLPPPGELLQAADPFVDLTENNE